MAPEKRRVEVPVDEDYDYEKNFRTALPQILAVCVKNLLLLAYGMTLGFPTILIPAVEHPKEGEVLQLGKTEISWIGSINLMVVPLGCALSGLLTAPIGRRRAMQIVNVPFVAAWLIFHYATKTHHLYAALFLTGLAGGLLEAPVLTYVAEITQPHLRGALAATSSMSIILGVFTQFLFGTFWGWRTIAAVNISFSVMAVIALCFVPESPHWLVSKERHEEARRSLQWLRGWTSRRDVMEELTDIQDQYVTENHNDSSFPNEESLAEQINHYTKRSFMLPFFLICTSFFVGNFSGMTTLQTYAVTIFEMLDAPIDKFKATLVLGILQVVGTASCVLLVHFTGKRPLTFVSTGGAAVCCFLIAAYDAYINSGRHESFSISDLNVTSVIKSEEIAVAVNPLAWIPTTLLMLLAVVTHTGIRLLPWILIGEILSAKTRSGGAGLASAVGYLFGFMTNKLYISMVDKLALWGTYSIYGVVCVLGCCIFYFMLPETEGKRLTDIENHFAGIHKLGNKVERSRKRKQRMQIATVIDSSGFFNPNFQHENDKWPSDLELKTKPRVPTKRF